MMLRVRQAGSHTHVAPRVQVMAIVHRVMVVMVRMKTASHVTTQRMVMTAVTAASRVHSRRPLIFKNYMLND